MMNKILTFDEFIHSHRLNEMAQVNLNEIDPKGIPYSKYKIYIYGEKVNSEEIKYKHFHMKSKAGNWDIRWTFDGNYHSYEFKGDGSFLVNKSIDTKLEKMVKNWLPMKNSADPTKTNLQMLELMWALNNEQN